MSAQLFGPTPIASVVANSVSVNQRLTVGPLPYASVSIVETSVAEGSVLSMEDSAGGGAYFPLISFIGAGGPPIVQSQMRITANTLNVDGSAIQFLAADPATTGLAFNSVEKQTTISVIDGAGAGASIPVLTITSTGGPPITAATAQYSVPVSHNSAVQSGVSAIAIGAVTIAIPIPQITANSVVLFSPLSIPDATCVGLHITLTAGVGFSVSGVGAATAAVPFSYFVAKY